MPGLRQGKYNMSLEQVVLPESKVVLEEGWERAGGTQAARRSVQGPESGTF